MPTDPVDNISLQILALPRDEDRSKVPPLFSAIVSSGDIVGYLPVKSTDNLDGTATPHVRIDGIVFDPDIDIGDVHLLNIANAKIDPATEPKQDAIITAIGNIATDTALGKRLKHYDLTKNVADSPVTLTVKADMDTVYTQTDSQVRNVIFTKPSQDITVKFTTVDGQSEAVVIKKNEIFSLSDFEFTTLEITITTNGTDLRILAEGV